MGPWDKKRGGRIQKYPRQMNGWLGGAIEEAIRPLGVLYGDPFSSGGGQRLPETVAYMILIIMKDLRPLPDNGCRSLFALSGGGILP